jgi:NAD(P)-dependent dehydrogenase (short-subunit alcohol dehydrogenase family)
VLVNNAGVAGERGHSADGFELTFAVNYLAHFVLTLDLLPIVRGRIVNVASGAQAPIDFDDPMPEGRRWDGMRAYSQSKLAQVMFTFELAERLGPGGPAVNALHPASLMDTKMVRRSFGRALTSVDKGAQPTLRLIVDAEGVTGRYFEGTREAGAHPQAYDAEARRQLWELSERLAREAVRAA